MNVQWALFKKIFLITVMVLAASGTFISESFAVRNTPMMGCDPYEDPNISNGCSLRTKVVDSSNPSNYFVYHMAKASYGQPYLGVKNSAGYMKCGLGISGDWSSSNVAIGPQNVAVPLVLSYYCWDHCRVVGGVTTCNMHCDGGGAPAKDCDVEAKWSVPAGTVNPGAATNSGQLYCRDDYNSLCCHSGEDSTYSQCCPLGTHAGSSYICCPNTDVLGAPSGSSQACGTKCCFSNEKCMNLASSLCCPIFPDGTIGDPCNTICCPAGQYCADKASGACLPNGTIPGACGTTTCLTGQVCVSTAASLCCDQDKACGSICCGASDKCTRRGTCIPQQMEECGVNPNAWWSVYWNESGCNTTSQATIIATCRPKPYCDPALGEYCSTLDIGEIQCCLEGQVCTGSKCKVGEKLVGQTCYCGDNAACPANQICCQGSCRDPLTDSNNCGSCSFLGNHACGNDGFGNPKICSDGKCRADTCSSNSDCPSGKVCPAGQCVCSSGTDCYGNCVNLSNNPSHCGMCGKVCYSGTCLGGACF